MTKTAESDVTMNDHTTSLTDIVSLVHESGNKQAEIVINRPEKLNALDALVLEALERKIAILEKEPVAVVRLRTAGTKAFIAGADIAAMQSMSVDSARAFASYGAHVFERLASLGAIVIAEVQGFALGGGFELALACDLIVASRNAQFGLPEVGLGLIPGFGGTQRLTRRIGYGKAIEMIATGKMIDAETAASLGIVNALTDSENLRARADEFANAILSKGSRAVAAAKRAVRASQEVTMTAGLGLEASFFGQCFADNESREGIAAFLEKRKPKF
jgi:enoyl-CoA hydratase